MPRGGVSAVADERDSIESHIEDTLAAGAGLCDPEVVQVLWWQPRPAPASTGWSARAWILPAWMKTADRQGKFHLHREGGHSHRRIIHAADATGKAIETTLEARVRAHPNIDLFEHHIAVDFNHRAQNRPGAGNRCLGAYAIDSGANQVKVFAAGKTVLATGGAGKVYLYTSNPDACTGDGIAMAWRAGLPPSPIWNSSSFTRPVLYHPRAKSFLISEALRGEGAQTGPSPTAGHSCRATTRGPKLAPRDVVARAIDHEMKRLGHDCVFPGPVRTKSGDFIEQHFPTINRRLPGAGHGYVKKSRLPVVPAAHYTCGGVVIDQKGQTDIAGLYAIGEVSCSGLPRRQPDGKQFPAGMRGVRPRRLPRHTPKPGRKPPAGEVAGVG